MMSTSTSAGQGAGSRMRATPACRWTATASACMTVSHTQLQIQFPAVLEIWCGGPGLLPWTTLLTSPHACVFGCFLLRVAQNVGHKLLLLAHVDA